MTSDQPLQELRAQAVRAVGQGKLSPNALAVMADLNPHALRRFLDGEALSTRAALRLSTVLGLSKALQIVSFEDPELELAAL